MAKRKGLWIFLIIFGGFVLVGVTFIFGLRALIEEKPVVHQNSVLRIPLSGQVTEKFSRDAVGRELEGANVDLSEIRKSLQMARVDDRIRGVYMRIGGVNMGWAKARELRSYLQAFKTSGKFVVAFMNGCNEMNLYLSLAADETYLQPHAQAELNGFAAEIPFLKRMFNKLGIEPQVDNIGKYKSAGDIFKRESMSPAHKEATQALLDDIYEAFVTAVSDSTALTRQEFSQALDRGVYSAEELYDLKLIDGLKFETEVFDELKRKVYDADSTDVTGRRLKTIDVRRYAKIPLEEVGLDKGKQIALIYAIGTILPGSGGYDPLNGRIMGAQSVIRMLHSAEQNKKVEAVVLRVDSPGGSGLASDEIWSAIQQLRKKKPVIISMSDVAASGGYWISMGSDAIVAQPLTITGSIGVVSMLFDLSGTYDKIGIDWGLVKKGRHADMFTDKRPMTPEEWQVFKKFNRDFYQYFVQKVADSRGKSFAEIDAIAQGRVWTGERALRYGLVDTLGGLDAALAVAKDKAGIAPDEPTRWIVYPQPKSFFETLMEKLSVRILPSSGMKMRTSAYLQAVPQEARQLLQMLMLLADTKKGDAWALATQIPEVR